MEQTEHSTTDGGEIQNDNVLENGCRETNRDVANFDFSCHKTAKLTNLKVSQCEVTIRCNSPDTGRHPSELIPDKSLISLQESASPSLSPSKSYTEKQQQY